MRLEVTQAHLDGGRRLDPENDAVALALRELVRPNVSVWVSTMTVGIMELNRSSSWRFSLPAELRRYILDLDRGRPVGPMVFEIPDIPARFLKSESNR